LSIYNDCKDAGGRATQERLPRRKKGRIAGYATLFTTQKMGKKTSQLGIFFAGNRLRLMNNKTTQNSVNTLSTIASPKTFNPNL